MLSSSSWPRIRSARVAVRCRRAVHWRSPARYLSTPSVGGSGSFPRSSSPKLADLKSVSDPLRQYTRLLEGPLAAIRSRILAKSIERPYEPLNRIKPAKLQKLFDQFQSLIERQFQTFHDPPKGVSPRPISDIQLKDFVNPRDSVLAQIVYNIHLNQVPTSFLKLNDISSKLQLIEQVLLKVLYKQYIAETLSQVRPLDTNIDYSNPTQWYPDARKMKRKIIMHVGPTNSGKTYNSLKKLAASRSGYYAGPLRLLAREIYENFNSRNISCNLVTGEEIIPSIDEFGKISELSSGTIEMIPLHKKMDICIIDEIQMIGDEKRGEAWTAALLGVQAKEIHVCGEESAVNLVKNIVQLTGDELEVNNYQRLGKLNVAETPLKDLKFLKPGDCVVAFSKRKILELKCEIERKTKFKVGVIYGVLPAELRSRTANGFNSGEYDVLVASDAVGMGLNLAIKRVVFSTTKKFNGSEVTDLTPSMIKQIAGRAGRFSHDKDKAGGEVTAMTTPGLKYVKKMMVEPNTDIEKACTWPTPEVWTTYVSKFSKNESVLSILLQFDKETRNHQNDLFVLTDLTGRYEILELFMRHDIYRRMSIEDQLQLSIAPVNLSKFSDLSRNVTFEYISTIVNNQSKSVMDFDVLPIDLLRQPANAYTGDEQIIQNLEKLEDSHKLVLLFLWLSQRWPTLFVDKESAMDWKSLIEKRMNEELNSLRRLTKSSRNRSKPRPNKTSRLLR